MNLLWLLVLAAVIGGYFWFKNRKVKEQVVQAKISSKTAEAHKAHGDDDSMPTDYIVTFLCDGKQLPLIVNHSFYDSAAVGATGKLTHIKDVFVEFEDDNPKLYH